ncbi:class I SAM-dependent methyltransferase [Anatilimnocola floriformis]|uniref:class I SAM-dependent methyltransferase n=1 Tax=Anatilimnocola floriformis TaxID=2948575 RepID=UPI0020C51239|nr:class I SAM-dependent methyltransferase [Anatilimnocola floriformis]
MRTFDPHAEPTLAELTAGREVAREVGLFWKEQLPAWLRLNLDVGAILDRGLVQLASTNLWGPANREPSQIMWDSAGEILRHGWLQLRAREKPRGYAGDHEMLGAIYQNRVTADPLGGAFDQYFLRQAAPQAVRNRMDLVRSEIEGGRSAKCVFIGSGAGLEIVSAFENDLPRESELWLLDLDPAAIDLAEKNLLPFVSPERLHCLAENLVRLPKKKRLLEQLAGADLVVCTGFFDYLEDEAAAELLKTFWQLLRPGGQALIFNFAPWNPTRAYMEWIGNWYLLYRTRDDLVSLARKSGIEAGDFAVTAEASGIDLLLRLSKPR